MPAVLSLTEQGKMDLLNKPENDLFDSTATSFHQKPGSDGSFTPSA